MHTFFFFFFKKTIAPVVATVSQAPVCCLWFGSIPRPGLLLFLSPFPGITGQPASALGMGWVEGGFCQRMELARCIFGLLIMRFTLCWELTAHKSAE